MPNHQFHADHQRSRSNMNVMDTCRSYQTVQYVFKNMVRSQHEDKVILLPFFIPVENKTGLVVSQEVFQLIDYIASCKQLQAFHGSKLLRILSDQGTEFVNQDFEKHARQREIHLATSPAHQLQSNGVAEQLGGLAKQCARCLLLAAELPDLYWGYANLIRCRDVKTQSTRLSVACTSLWRRGRYVAIP